MAVLTSLVRRRQAPCVDVALALPAYVAGETELDPRSAQHVSQCLRCQAEVVRYRRMLRTLHDLRDDAPRPPSTVLAEIIETLGADDPARRRLVELAVLVGVTAGALAGAGAVLWLTQREGPQVGPASVRRWTPGSRPAGRRRRP